MSDTTPEKEMRDLYVQGAEHEKAQRFNAAKECYVKSAGLGYGRSEFRLAMFYLQGQGGELNKTKAFSYFINAASHENRDQSKACFNLGLMLENGDGVTKNLDEAFRWYSKAAELGLQDAENKREEIRPRVKAGGLWAHRIDPPGDNKPRKPTGRL